MKSLQECAIVRNDGADLRSSHIKHQNTDYCHRIHLRLWLLTAVTRRGRTFYHFQLQVITTTAGTIRCFNSALEKCNFKMAARWIKIWPESNQVFWGHINSFSCAKRCLIGLFTTKCMYLPRLARCMLQCGSALHQLCSQPHFPGSRGLSFCCSSPLPQPCFYSTTGSIKCRGSKKAPDMIVRDS